MVLLRRVIGDALRARRQAQHRTLREVSTAANVSLGYLSEIERGQKEPSSELLSAVCEALGAQLSELLRDVSHTVEHAERGAVPAGRPATSDLPPLTAQPAAAQPAAAHRIDPDEAGQPAVRTTGADRLVGAGRNARATATASAAGRPATGRPAAKAGTRRPVVTTTVDGDVAVTVRQDGPLRATLHATRSVHAGRGRDLTPV